MRVILTSYNVNENTGTPKRKKIHANLVSSKVSTRRVNDSSFKCYKLFFFSNGTFI